jgi:subtilisin family serine protease
MPENEAVPELVKNYQASGLVDYAEPDYLSYTALTSPNDPYYTSGKLWGLNNYGQNYGPASGTPDADIDAPEAWDVLTSASNVVVAVLDTGIRYTHEDLASNMWVNPNDGGHGFNAVAGTNDPNDDSSGGHGTLMAGIIGGVGNNGKGITGVAWQVQLMACKCFNSSNTASSSDIIACIDYARTNGARVMNASFSSPSNSLSLSNAIYSARAAGIIFVASAGNGPPTINIDTQPLYPATYQIDNVVSVAYSNPNDGLGTLSNYGATNVDLAAPGEQIYSTYNSSDSSYFPPTFITTAGTSYAAAMVSGAFALMVAKYPAETHQQVIARVLAATDPLPALAGKCATGGRLNLRNALSPPIRVSAVPVPQNSPFQLRVSAGPNRTCIVESSMTLTNWFPVLTNTTSTNGTFDYVDTQLTNAPRRFYRAVSTL